MKTRPVLVMILAAAAALALAGPAGAQRGAPPGGRGAAGPAGRGAPSPDASFDPTGYWVSLVSDEWRYRMITPPKGNIDYVPLNAEGRRIAGMWDPERDQANGEQCKGYGAGGIMRLPGRLHVTWDDASTLRIDLDTGTQARVLHFGGTRPATAEPTWQGYSVAEWQFVGRGAVPAGQFRPGQLKVVTTRLRPGYLRKNGVPYGANAVLTEYFNELADDDGLRYLAVTSMLDDPEFLLQPWVRTSQFKMQPDSNGWNPSPCSAR